MKITYLLLSITQLVWLVAANLSYKSKPTQEYMNTSIPLSPYWGESLSAPYETNSFFENFVVQSGFLPINIYPYLLRIERVSGGVGVSAGSHLDISDKNVTAPFILDWVIAIREGNFEKHEVTKYDKMSLTMRFERGTGWMTMPFVRGAALLTGEVSGITPTLYTEQGILKVTDKNGDEVTWRSRSDRFVIVLQDLSTWVLFVSEPATIFKTATNVSFLNAFTGTFRLAYIGKNKQALGIYEKYKDAIPTSV